MKVTVHAPAQLPAVQADRGRIAQVLGNLLGNALKFTPSGGHVELRGKQAGSDVLFEVSDSGPGIPHDQQPHLFDRFWQARRGDGRGVGLGLAISKGIVEAHKGHIWVESEPGRGSRFYFVIPATDRARVLAPTASN